MPESLPPRPIKYELPSVVSVLKNVAAFQAVPVPLPAGTFEARAGFRVGGQGLAEAHAIMEWGEDEGIGCTAGHYNPAKDEWSIFPECVPKTSQARALAIEMRYKLPKARREALAEGRRPGGGFIDYHSPATQTARQQLEQYSTR